jgi:TatD DNase family protein
MIVDSHAHLDFPDFQSDLELILDRAWKAGVHRVLTVGSGTGPGNLEVAIELAGRFGFLDASIGIHPHEARLATEADYASLKELARHPKVVAWGEIGLDYHYDLSPREIQREVFQRQLTLAKETQLPVIIHTREAENDTMNLLRTCWEGRPGVMHCFSGSQRLAEVCLEMGFMISFSGILTFPKAQEIREAAKRVPLERLLIETDSPYLAPVPYRGKRNEPAYVIEAAKALAHIKGISLEELGEAVCRNYFQLFGHETNCFAFEEEGIK